MGWPLARLTGRDRERSFAAHQEKPMSDRLTEDVTKLQGRFTSLKAEVGKVLVGQDEMLHRLILGLLAGGHVLLEGLPVHDERHLRRPRARRACRRHRCRAWRVVPTAAV